nr:hypothetical protein [Tanacetum cinerariifolium]
MNPNIPNTFNHYDIYFHDDVKRYRQGYEAYEQFLAMSNQEAEGSGSDPKRMRTYIPRQRKEAKQRLIDDYFGEDDTPTKYPKEDFRRRYRLRVCGDWIEVLIDFDEFLGVDFKPAGDFPCRVVSVSVHGLRCNCLLRASNFVLKIGGKRVTEASSIHIDFGFSAPYFDLPFLRSGIPNKSLTPRIQWDFTPGESFTLPPIHRLRALYGRLDGPPIPSPRASPSYLS